MVLCRGANRSRRGLTVVEGAVVLGTCLLFLMAIFEYGRFLMIRQLLINAAREGARQAAVSPDSVSTASIQGTVISSLAGQPVDGVHVAIYEVDPQTGNSLGPWCDTPFGSPLAVEITGGYHPLLPSLGILPDPVPINVVCIMSSEAN